MLQPRALLCLSLVLQVWAQGDPSSGSSDDPIKCQYNNVWWTYLNGTTGDSCHIALLMRQAAGLRSTPSGDPTSMIRHAENAQLCLPAVYDMYGACLACMETAPPATSQIVSWSEWCTVTNGTTDLATSRSIEGLGPAWTKTVNFTHSIWNLNTIHAQVQGSGQATGLTAPNPPSSSVGGSHSTTVASASTHKSSNIGPIVGGVIGGLAVISIAAAVFFFYLRRRNRKVAPSSEFTRYIQPGGTVMSTRAETALSGSRGTIPRQDSAMIPLTAGEDEAFDSPPAFTPGQYTGPVFEKDGYRADPNAPLYSSGNAVSQPSYSQNSPQGPSGAAL